MRPNFSMSPSSNAVSQNNLNKNKTNLSCASTIYFAMGVVCFSLAGVLFLIESRTELSASIKPFFSIVRNIMISEQLAIVTLCLTGLIVIFVRVVFWFKKDLTVTGQPKKSFANFICMLRPAALSLLFIYAMFPLQGLHLGSLPSSAIIILKLQSV